ncbi:aminopeptidase M1-B-like [Typha latifolia]|uniref:aminopeptidase M1-B-like n=1 Tax=Typha latifolia TaxID=4733 RepID=UPI003C2F5DAA
MAMNESWEQFKNQARLPKFAFPRRYDLFIKPDLSACVFSGTVLIAVEVVAETRFLVLNAADLAIDRDSVRFKNHKSDQEIRPSEIILVEEDEILVLGFLGALPIGEGIVTIEFTGTLNDKMRGFYRSKYEYNGETRNMAVTQFESADARRCFPCWDEPAFKATFKITMEVPSDLVALSCMPIVHEKVDGLDKILSFAESPVMSTYLVAIVVGLFDFIEDIMPDGTKVRVYTQIGKRDQGKFALGVAVKTLDLYKDYFAVPYPLPKLDMIAIPDFAAGAMENYGLITYRETYLLYDDRLSSAMSKQSVAITVAHELAHQWFGNLVTMEWWTHLWLNEGFASWVSYLAVDALFPEWNIWTQFLDETSSGLKLDGLAESHPIEVEINHVSEIDAIFDSISYEKGASIIRMLQNYLGPACFQRALASYIKRYAYSNAKTEDLWAVLEEESGEPVRDLMNSWTKQKGYPVISVKLNEHSLELEQTQFLSDGSSGSGMWIVPLTSCCCSYDSQTKFLLKAKLDINKLTCRRNANKECGEGFWIKLNIDQTGFYRVKYDDELAAGLRYAIQANKLSLMDKIGVIEDSYALCVACKQTLSSLLFLLKAYGEEFDYTVLSHIISVSCAIENIVADAIPELSNDVRLILIDLLQSTAEKLGWDPKDGESHLDVMLRADILTALVKLGHNNTVHEALRRLEAFLNDSSTFLLPPDTRKAAYLAVMQTVSTSNRSGYESLLRIYREADQSEERVRVLGVLAYCPDKDIVLESLNLLLTSEVRNQDAFYGLRTSREGRETAWGWLKDNWEYISKTWASSSLISSFVHAIVSLFTSDEKAEEIEEFFASRVKPSFERALKQSLEEVRNKARWIRSIRNDRSLEDVVKELLPKA